MKCKGGSSKACQHEATMVVTMERTVPPTALYPSPQVVEVGVQVCAVHGRRFTVGRTVPNAGRILAVVG